MNNTNILCVVHPDGLWSFPLSLSDNETNNSTVATEEAVKTIKTINPAVMVQHILCSKRHVYNALFEILNIPYIGSDAHVSANMVDKGNFEPIFPFQIFVTEVSPPYAPEPSVPVPPPSPTKNITINRISSNPYFKV